MDINKLLSETEVELLQGGTVGEVKLLKCEDINYVLKIQRKWERHGDPDCWRREYDLYMNGFDKEIAHIKIPQCYHISAENDTTYILMEYLQASTSNDLTIDDLAYAAFKLGVFHRDMCDCSMIPWLRSYPAVVSSFDLWYGKMRSTLAQPMKGFPEDIRHILNDYANRSDEVLQSFDILPRTICHGDVHHDNIFRCNDDVYLIDWDSAGHGFLGEDAVDMLCEAFVYSDRDVSLMADSKRSIIEAYTGGAKIDLGDTTVRDIFAMAWGFRIAATYMYHDEYTDKQRCIDILKYMLM